MLWSLSSCYNWIQTTFPCLKWRRRQTEPAFIQWVAKCHTVNYGRRITLMKYSFEWRKWCTFSSLSWPSWYSMSILWVDWTATPLHWVQIVGWRKIEQNRILYLQTYFDCWCNWRVLSSCYLLGPLAHPGPGIWPFPSPQQILSPRDGLLQVQIRPSLKSLENCHFVPWHKESHSVKKISATLIDWKLIQGRGSECHQAEIYWMSSWKNTLRQGSWNARRHRYIFYVIPGS